MRYLPHSDGERREMLDAIGVPGIDALFADVPPSKLLRELPGLPRARSEMAVERAMSALAARNVPPARFPSSPAAALTSITSRRPSITSFSGRSF